MALIPPKPSSSKPLPKAPSQPARPEIPRFRRSLAFEREINRAIERDFRHLLPPEREYLKAAFSFGRPGQETRLRPGEYDKIVAKLEANQRDRVSPRDISRLKELKERLFR